MPYNLAHPLFFCTYIPQICLLTYLNYVILKQNVVDLQNNCYFSW